MNYSFTFIIPVHNGMPYIKDCIASILSQNYDNFNIVILENCSSDGTYEYIKKLNNNKISVFESDSLLSIEQNFSRILNIQKKEFTVITCADDLYQNNYLNLIIDLIKKYPKASVYRTQMDVIDEKNKTIFRPYIKRKIVTEEQYLEGRLKHTYFETLAGYCCKTKNYNDIKGIKCIHKLMHTDDILIMDLSRKSYLAISDEYGAFYRSHSKSTSRLCNQQTALEGYNYFFKYIHQLENKKLIEIVRKNLPYHIFRIKNFFDTNYINEMKKMFTLYKINDTHFDKQIFIFRFRNLTAQLYKKIKNLLRFKDSL